MAWDKESTCQYRRPGFDPWVGKIPWRRKWQPTPVFLPGKSHGQRHLVGYSPWGHKVSDTTELLRTQTHTHTHTHTDSRLGSKLKRNADRSLVSENDWLGCFRLNFPFAKEKTKQTKKKQGQTIKNICLLAMERFQGKREFLALTCQRRRKPRKGDLSLAQVLHGHFADSRQ